MDSGKLLQQMASEMSEHQSRINSEGAIQWLMRFLAIEGVTGQEQAIAADIQKALVEIGVPAANIRYDQANTRIPLPTQTGNLIADLPGTRSGPRLMFMTHMDTVPLAAGAKPIRQSDRIVPEGRTALGGDDRTGVACLIAMTESLLRDQLPHPPITLLFTVREESGLFGAKHLNLEDVKNPRFGFNVDGRSATDITIGAVGAERWEVEITGKAAHAGVHPERGISSSVVTAIALADVFRRGWFGKVTQGDRLGTSNVGSIGDKQGRCAGQATNVVTDYVRLTGESRSHDPEFATAITKEYADAFAKAALEVKNDEGQTAEVRFESRHDYYPFRMNEDDAVVQHALRAAKSLGWTATTRIANGGLDANWMVRHGVPTVTIGAGQNQIHTIEEFVDLTEFQRGCAMALALATIE
jgi:tripeptide aminopeptidase